MNKIKSLIFFCLLFIPISVSAKQYDITNYYIDVTVNKDNIYEIKEYYNLLFLEESSFKREISLRPKVYLTNGKFISYITEISNINAEEIKSSVDSKKYKIIFPKEKIDTSKGYALSYTYNMGTDLDEDSDVVFINLIDGSLDIIGNTSSFLITLPTDIKKEDVVFYKNGKKIKEENEIEYIIENNILEGVINQMISKGDIISVQIKFPNNFFSNIKKTDSPTSYLLLLIPIICLTLTILGYKKYKRKKIEEPGNVLEITNIFDSAEIAYLYKGKINVTHLISLLFTLASGGYITFKNYGSKDRVSFKIIKKKEYDKDNAAQKILFDGLFQNKDEIEIYDIEGIFYLYYIDAKRTLQNKKNDKKLFHTFSKKLKLILTIVACIGLSLLQIKPLYNVLDSYVYATIASLILSAVVVVPQITKNKAIKIIFLILSIIIPIFEIYALIDFKLNLIIYCIGLVLLYISLIINDKIPIRTIYGNQILYEIEEFKNKLATMSVEEFEEKLKQNPNYFFDMIPYVIVFDLTTWWFNHFGSDLTEAPVWYESSEPYTSEKLETFINEVIRQMIVPMQTNRLYEDELLNQAPNKLL